MRRRQYLLLVVLTIVAGPVGGAVSNWVLMARIATAEEAEPHYKVITAEEFRLVDDEGKIRAVLGTAIRGSAIGLFMYDKDGKVRVGLSEGMMGYSLFMDTISISPGRIYMYSRRGRYSLGITGLQVLSRLL